MMAIYRLTANAVFEPDVLQGMYRAFEEVCAILGELGLSSEENDRLIELAAQQIIEDAKAGERRPPVMRNSALRVLTDAIRNS